MIKWRKLFQVPFARPRDNRYRRQRHLTGYHPPTAQPAEMLEDRSLLSGNAIVVLAGDGTGTAAATELPGPTSTAVDDAGNVYLADVVLKRILKISPDQKLTTVAGGGRDHFFEGREDARDVLFYSPPLGLASDKDGALFFSTALRFPGPDNVQKVIVKVSADHSIEVIAGAGRDSEWDGSERAEDLELDYPREVAVDDLGRVYFSDRSRLLRVNTDGDIDIIAGGGDDAEWDGGEFATDLRLERLSGLAIDSSGAVFFSDSLHGRVAKISPDSTIELVAGGGNDTEWDGSEQAKDLEIGDLSGLAVDSNGDIYIAAGTQDRVVKIHSDGNIEIVAGGGTETNWRSGDQATEIKLNAPKRIAVDLHKNVYVPEFNPARVIRVKPDRTIEVLAGGTGDVDWDGTETAEELRLGRVEDLAVDHHGNIYFSDSERDRIVKLGPRGKVEIVAGGGRAQTLHRDSLATDMRIDSPRGVAVDLDGTFYFTELRFGTYSGPVIVKVNSDGIAEVIAGGGENTRWNDGDIATDLRLGRPDDIAVDANGNIYFLDFERGYIVQIQSDGAIRLRAGGGSDSDWDGTELASDLSFYRPGGLTIDEDGALYFSHFHLHDAKGTQIVKVNSDNSIDIFAGGGTKWDWNDGERVTDLRLTGAAPPVFGPDGRAYFGASGQLLERKDDGTILVIAGGGSQITVSQGDNPRDLVVIGNLAVGLSGPIFIAQERILGLNSAPSIISAAAATVTENSQHVAMIAAIDTDLPTQTLKYAVTGGADRSLFQVEPSSGRLSFVSRPDFENPSDADLNNLYHLQVTVTDVGGLTDVSDIEVTVTDVNESPVIVSDGEQSATSIVVPENDVAVTVVTAVDEDVPAQAVTYSISGGADEDSFFIEAATGALSFRSAPDFEEAADADKDNVYHVYVSATDSAGMSDTQELAVHVRNENEAPIISNGEGGTIRIDVVENRNRVTVVEASDEDGPEQALTFSLGGGSDRALFHVFPTTGVLHLKGHPDFENPRDFDGDNVYHVQVLVSDDGSLSDVLDLVVTVTDMNDRPVITSNNGSELVTTTINENERFVATVIATDEDRPRQTLTYTITGGTDRQLFDIDSENGELAFATPPDADIAGDADRNNVYHVEVTVVDDGTAPGSTQQEFAVTVRGVNERPAIIHDDDHEATSITIEENRPFVTTVSATDSDFPKQKLTFGISESPDSELFLIDPVTGQLEFIQPPNFEAPLDTDQDNVYRVRVIVTDDGDGSLSDSHDIIVNVSDVNENPVITSQGGKPVATIEVNENQTAVTTVVAADEDAFSQTLTYGIIAAGDDALFDIDSSTGVITYKQAPDFESPVDSDDDNVYRFRVSVTDNGTPSLSDFQDLVIRVVEANEPPKIISNGAEASANIEVTEGQTIITTVLGLDADVYDDDLSYRFVGGVDQPLFSLDEVTGLLTFDLPPDAERPVDTNGDNQYQVIVAVFDSEGLSDTQDITVTVTNVNEAPEITGNSNIRVEENQEYVVTVGATDDDIPSQRLTFSITGGDDAAYFEIDSLSGLLQFVEPPNYEVPSDADGDNSYDVHVTVTDDGSGMLSDSIRLKITVGNANEAPLITTDGGKPSATVTVAENQEIVTTVLARDPDRSITFVNYSISGGRDAALFVIDPTTGTIRFKDAPDAEVPDDSDGDNLYHVQVAATETRLDGLAGFQDIAVSVIDVNEPPVITSFDGAASTVITLAENTTAVGQITAMDPDSLPEELTYAIAGGTDREAFEIDARTGVLTFSTPPDFESPIDEAMENTYNILISVNDNSGEELLGYQALWVSVTDINEPPVITSNGGGPDSLVPVFENTTAVTRVTATDEDQDSLTLIYSISGGGDQTLFEIDPQTGELVFNTSPDFEDREDADQNGIYDVQVTVTESGSDSLTDVQHLRVAVFDINEPPTFTSPDDVLEVSENESEISSLTASDTDLPAQELTYGIVGGPDAELLTVDPAEGTLSFVDLPDFENPRDSDGDNIYVASVSVTDNGDGHLSSIRQVAIAVLDQNEPPRIVGSEGQNSSVVFVEENQTFVADISATDVDSSSQLLTYSLSCGEDQGLFEINSETGTLTFRSAPSYLTPTDQDGNNSYEVHVTVSDGELSDSQAISVKVSQRPPSVPPPVTFSMDSTTNTPTFSWGDADRAESFEVWVGRVFPSPSRVLADESIVDLSSWTPLTNLPPGFYRLWVRGINREGLPGPWSSSSSIDIKPVLIDAERATFDSRPTFEWNEIPHTSGYDIFLRTQDPAVGDIVIRNLPPNTTSFTPEQDLPWGTTRWWVRSSDSRFNKGWSEAGRLHVRGTAITSANREGISWLKTAGAGRYVLYVEDAQANLVVRENRITGTTYDFRAEMPSGAYRAWVKAIDATTDTFGSGRWSRGFIFRVVSESQTENSELLVGESLQMESESDMEVASEQLRATSSSRIWAANQQSREPRMNTSDERHRSSVDRIMADDQLLAAVLD